MMLAKQTFSRRNELIASLGINLESGIELEVPSGIQKEPSLASRFFSLSGFNQPSQDKALDKRQRGPRPGEEKINRDRSEEIISFLEIEDIKDTRFDRHSELDLVAGGTALRPHQGGQPRRRSGGEVDSKSERCIKALRDTWYGGYENAVKGTKEDGYDVGVSLSEGIVTLHMPSEERMVATPRTWLANNLKLCHPVSKAGYANNACDPADGWTFQHHYHSYDADNYEQIFAAHGLKPEDCADVAIPYMVRPKPFDHAAETEKRECTKNEIECATAALCRDHVFHIDWLGNQFDTVDPGTARGRYAQMQAENTLHRNICPVKIDEGANMDWDKGCHGSVKDSTGTTFKDMNAREKHAFCLDTFSTKTCTEEDKTCEMALFCYHLPLTAINYNNNWYRPKTQHEAGTAMASPPSTQGVNECFGSGYYNSNVYQYQYHDTEEAYKNLQNTDCMTPTKPHEDDYTLDDWNIIAEKFDGCTSVHSRSMVCDMNIVPILPRYYSQRGHAGNWQDFIDASGVTPQACKAFANTVREQSSS